MWNGCPGTWWYRGGREWWSSEDFDGDVWAVEARTHAGRRVRMVADLLSRGLVGRPLGEIDRLLGTDDSERGSGFAEGRGSAGGRTWYLGGSTRLFADPVWLVLDADENGRVAKAAVVTDD